MLDSQILLALTVLSIPCIMVSLLVSPQFTSLLLNTFFYTDLQKAIPIKPFENSYFKNVQINAENPIFDQVLDVFPEKKQTSRLGRFWAKEQLNSAALKLRTAKFLTHYRIFEKKASISTPVSKYSQRVVLFLHGFAGSSFSFRETYTTMMENANSQENEDLLMIAPDILSYGYSDRVVDANRTQFLHRHFFKNYDIAAAKIVVSLLKTVAVDEKKFGKDASIDFICHSFGCRVLARVISLLSLENEHGIPFKINRIHQFAPALVPEDPELAAQRESQYQQTSGRKARTGTNNVDQANTKVAPNPIANSKIFQDIFNDPEYSIHKKWWYLILENWIKLFTEGFSKFFLWRSVVRKLLVDFYFCPKTDISKTSPLAFFVPNTKQDKSNPQKSIIPDVPLDKQHLINDKIIDLYAAPLRIPGTASNLIEFSSKNARGDELFHSQIYALFLKGYGNPKLFSDSFSNVIVFGEEDRHVPIAQGRELLNDLKRELGTRKGVCKVDGNECADKVVLKVIPQACHNPQETHILETKEILLH